MAAYLCVSLRQKWRRQLSLTMAHPRIDASDVMREPVGVVNEIIECVIINPIQQKIATFECSRTFFNKIIKLFKAKQLSTKFGTSKRCNIFTMEVKQAFHPNGAQQHPWVVLQQYSA